MTLARKTPLRRTPFRRKAVAQYPAGAGDRGTAGRKTGVKAKRREKVDLVKRLDIVFSAYIRLRDAMQGGMTRCVSCGRVLPFTGMQCGHYFTRHNMSVRWDEDNCSSQCVECNCHRSGNIEGYTPNLIMKIGREAYDALCVRAREERKWNDDELTAMIRHYTAEVRRLSREKEIDVRI